MDKCEHVCSLISIYSYSIAQSCQHREARNVEEKFVKGMVLKFNTMYNIYGIDQKLEIYHICRAFQTLNSNSQE